jgi:site-specific DNA-cytosine methylase
VRVLVACEYSGAVRDAFTRKGHYAMSCDILPTASPGPHHQGDVLLYLDTKWDLMIAFPPCTHLAVSGARWFKDKVKEQKQALDFVRLLMDAPIDKIAIENPVSIISTKIRKPDQIIQPWQHGDPYTKTTCLWLKGLPLLKPTNIVSKGEYVIHGGKKIQKWYSNRERPRDMTFSGIATAMAEQWG